MWILISPHTSVLGLSLCSELASSSLVLCEPIDPITGIALFSLQESGAASLCKKPKVIFSVLINSTWLLLVLVHSMVLFPSGCREEALGNKTPECTCTEHFGWHQKQQKCAKDSCIAGGLNCKFMLVTDKSGELCGARLWFC